MFSGGTEPLRLNQDEQVVFAVRARALPTLSDAIGIAVLAPTLAMMPWLIVHFGFRKTVYVITTQRVLSLEPHGVVAEMRLNEIVSFRGTRSALLLKGEGARLWLPRLPDAWQFETLIRNVLAKMGHKV